MGLVKVGTEVAGQSCVSELLVQQCDLSLIPASLLVPGVLLQLTPITRYKNKFYRKIQWMTLITASQTRNGNLFKFLSLLPSFSEPHGLMQPNLKIQSQVWRESICLAILLVISRGSIRAKERAVNIWELL